jgi:uncharacterized protein (DUF983 family)
LGPIKTFGYCFAAATFGYCGAALGLTDNQQGFLAFVLVALLSVHLAGIFTYEVRVSMSTWCCLEFAMLADDIIRELP